MFRENRKYFKKRKPLNPNRIQKFGKRKTVKLNKAVFLDRDGTIIEDINYLSDPDKVMLLINIIPALQLLTRNDFKLILTTNQSGISRGYFTRKKLDEIHSKLVTLLALNRIKFDRMYFCPHHPDQNCFCRKPKPGMAFRANKALQLDLRKCYSVGDRISDVEFGKNFGGKGILVLTGYGRKEKQRNKAVFVAKDLLHAAQWIVKNDEKR